LVGIFDEAPKLEISFIFFSVKIDISSDVKSIPDCNSIFVIWKTKADFLDLN